MQSSENESEYDYTMISNEFDYELIRKSERFGVKHYKDSVYKGELEN